MDFNRFEAWLENGVGVTGTSHHDVNRSPSTHRIENASRDAKQQQQEQEQQQQPNEELLTTEQELNMALNRILRDYPVVKCVIWRLKQQMEEEKSLQQTLVENNGSNKQKNNP